VFAQVKYEINSKSEKTCPELVSDGDGYRCTLIERDEEARDILMDGECDDPKLAHLKKKVDASAIVKEYFPKATEAEVMDILWSHTSFPDFWDIPRDGWTATQCLRTQLGELAAVRT